ncbi:hypothetical protein F0562_024026 [Nyssa sinensis]|uniref:Uncharacterized protein n=1 Tax=Nyssa sinensis TaxID=561372 RepID=A0A5J5BJG7_9ASTE|nr:hypothetical protein F0562_024026 [Nyssa sinensis]
MSSVGEITSMIACKPEQRTATAVKGESPVELLLGRGGPNSHSGWLSPRHLGCSEGQKQQRDVEHEQSRAEKRWSYIKTITYGDAEEIFGLLKAYWLKNSPSKDISIKGSQSLHR